jgi:succinate-acetate transporter protein
MNYKLASPKALGYAAIFITGWLFSLYNTQWYTTMPGGMNLITGLVVGGVALGIAGIFSYLYGETYEGTLFLGLGAFFFSVSLNSILAGMMQGSAFSAYAGWLWIVWTVFFLYMWLGVRLEKGFLVSLFLLALWLTFLDMAVANWIASRVCMYVGGYIGLVTAALAAILSARALWKRPETPEMSHA